jgi:hypothetical protein
MLNVIITGEKADNRTISLSTNSYEGQAKLQELLMGAVMSPFPEVFENMIVDKLGFSAKIEGLSNDDAVKIATWIKTVFLVEGLPQPTPEPEVQPSPEPEVQPSPLPTFKAMLETMLVEANQAKNLPSAPRLTVWDVESQIEDAIAADKRCNPSCGCSICVAAARRFARNLRAEVWSKYTVLDDLTVVETPPEEQTVPDIVDILGKLLPGFKILYLG